MKKWLLCIFLLIAGVAEFHAVSAFAQQQPAATSELQKPFDKRRLLVPPKNPDGSLQVTPFFEDPVLWLRDQQQNFYGAMAKSMRSLQQENSWTAAWTLMLLSLAYGVFHAAGPGHGKAVISGWLLATESQLRRGILVAFMSSIVQALVAILLVSGALLLLKGAGSAAKNMAGYLESVSFGLIAVMGAYLLWTGLKSLKVFAPVMRMVSPPASVTHVSAASPTGHHFEIVNPLPVNMAHDHEHGPDCGCGHAHVPAPSDVSRGWSWKRAISLSLAVGIRPCTGGLLVLLFANALGMYGIGIIATFVMALGTFATVSAVATLAVYSKKLAERLASRDDRWLSGLNSVLRLGGGAGILLFGAALFFVSLSGPVGNF